MVYTESEIVKLYKEAADKVKQLTILSELTCKEIPEVIKILHKNGMYYKGDIDYFKKEIIEYFTDGGTLTELSQKYHMDACNLRNYLNSRGIETPKSGKNCKKKKEKTEDKDIDQVRVIMEYGLNFALGTAFGWILRSTEEEDIEKKIYSLKNARDFIDREIDMLEGK